MQVGSSCDAEDEENPKVLEIDKQIREEEERAMRKRKSWSGKRMEGDERQRRDHEIIEKVDSICLKARWRDGRVTMVIALKGTGWRRKKLDNRFFL